MAPFNGKMFIGTVKKRTGKNRKETESILLTRKTQKREQREKYRRTHTQVQPCQSLWTGLRKRRVVKFLTLMTQETFYTRGVAMCAMPTNLKKI
jgi:hypothetical protein